MISVGKERKFFDLREANRTLPLVSRIVRDVVDANARMREIHLEARQSIENGQTREAEALQDRLQQLGFERSTYVEELEELGIELKDPNVGLVDFPAMLDGRIVYLCWKLGEEAIDHWHELSAGFAGRRPVGDEF